MLLILSSSLLISLSLSLIMASSPLSLGLWVILIALATSWLISILFSSWFALVTFLIYVGGMLVMFAYFMALTPNKPMNMSLSLQTFFLATMTILGLFKLSSSLSPYHLTSSLTPLLTPMTAMYTQANIPILLILVIILFLIMVAVVKIANLSSGPLRPFLYV